MNTLSNNNLELLTFLNDSLDIRNNKIKVINNNYIELININMIINDNKKYNEGKLINKIVEITDNQYNLMKLDLLRILKNHKRNIKKLILNPKKFIYKPFSLVLVYSFINSLIIDIEENYNYISSFTQLITYIFDYFDETKLDDYNDDLMFHFNNIEKYKFYLKYKQLKAKIYKIMLKSNEETKRNIKLYLLNQDFIRSNYKNLLIYFNFKHKDKEIIKKYLKVKQIYLMFTF